MTARWKLALGGVLAGVALLGFSAGTLFAQAAPAWQPTHADMHTMMDAMHGEGFSDRMHAAMGDEAEAMMDQCAAMMGMMARMGPMMGQGDMMSRMMGR